MSKDLLVWYDNLLKKKKDVTEELSRLRAMKTVLEADLQKKREDVMQKLGISIEDLPAYVSGLEQKLLGIKTEVEKRLGVAQ